MYSINGTNPVSGKPEKFFYLVYRNNEKQIEEKAIRAGRPDDMTATRAATLRGPRIRGASSNAERRAKQRAEKGRMTISRLWDEYSDHRVRRKSLGEDCNRFDQLFRPALGDKIPVEVDSLSLNRFRVKLAKTNSERSRKLFSPTKVGHAMALLRSIVNFGVHHNLTIGFPSKVPVPPMPANMRTEDLSEDKFAALMKALDEEVGQDAAELAVGLVAEAEKLGGPIGVPL